MRKTEAQKEEKPCLKLFTNSVEPESMSLQSQPIAPFLPLILISTNLGVLQQRTRAAHVKLTLEMETKIMYRKRILTSLLLLTFAQQFLGSS